MDKDGRCVEAWSKLGAGFVEVGTVTPEPQTANAGLIILRNISEKALWNKLGFPSEGAQKVLERLEKLPSPRTIPLFLNIGKNRTTPNETAHEDYIRLMNLFSKHADVFVLNISSPNTAGLRDLLKKENLSEFLNKVLKNKTTPVLLKLSPDLSLEDLTTVLETSLAHEIDGFIFTNTTTSRPTLSSFPTEGGVSGLPLKNISINVLKNALQILSSQRKDKLIISCGGIMNREDVVERLQLGADLVQVYSALIFEGPSFFRRTRLS